MNIGDRVFYRMSREDAGKVNQLRLDYKNYLGLIQRHREAMLAKFPDLSGTDLELLDDAGDHSGFQPHIGDMVTVGMLLPADVVLCYSIAELGDENLIVHDADPKKIFSGVADLRVLLPGNDVLWVPRAMEDDSPEPQEGRGYGVTSLPKHGMFTTNQPASLVR